MSYLAPGLDELMHKALSVPDIVESILLGLPLRQIILTRRVCHHFDKVFHNSPRIRQALLLEPVTGPLEWHAEDHSLGRGEWKSEADAEAVVPFLNPFVPVAEDAGGWQFYQKQWYHQENRQPRDLHFGRGETLAFVSSYRYCRFFEVNFPGVAEPGKRRRPLPQGISESSEGLWKRMQLTHPPVHQIELFSWPGQRGERRALIHGLNNKVTRVCANSTIANYLDTCVDLCLAVGSNWVENLHYLNVAVLTRSVDEITGFEMLDMLH